MKINKDKHVVLFHLSKYSDKLYGNIVYKIQIEMSNFIARFQNFDFQDFLAVTAFLIAFLIKSNNKKLDQIIFHVSDNLIIFHVQSYFALHKWNILEHP